MTRSKSLILLAILLAGAGCFQPPPAQGDTPVTCGDGTTLVGTACQPVVTCGANTTVQNGQCVGTATSLTCGPNTTEQSGQCVGTGSTLTCGANTTQQNGQCVGTGTSVTCGPGTSLVSGQCRVVMSSVCGTDTTVANGGTTCVGSVTCGAGTVRSGAACVPSGTALCGQGTSWSGTQCVVVPASPSFATFTGLTTPATSFFDRDNSTTSNNLHRYRFVVTDLTAGVADAWTEVVAPMVGTGSAVHLSWNHNTSFPVSTTAQTIQVRDASDGAGHCLTSLQPHTEPSSNIDGTYVNYFAWNAAVATPSVCGVAGSITFAREATTPERIRVTFNVQFSDGSSWLNKTFYAPYRKGT